MGDAESLLSHIESAHELIGYTPITDEPDFKNYLEEHSIRKPLTLVPHEKDSDPHGLAQKYSNSFREKKVVVFVPGRAFDASGTRLGRGGGWYDRFLSALPDSWVIVGTTIRARVHEDSLPRKEWDIPVAYLLIENGGSWSVQKT